MYCIVYYLRQSHVNFYCRSIACGFLVSFYFGFCILFIALRNSMCVSVCVLVFVIFVDKTVIKCLVSCRLIMIDYRRSCDRIDPITFNSTSCFSCLILQFDFSVFSIFRLFIWFGLVVISINL